MLKGYWIVRVDIADEEQYMAYMAANLEPLKRSTELGFSPGLAASRIRRGQAAPAMR